MKNEHMFNKKILAFVCLLSVGIVGLPAQRAHAAVNGLLTGLVAYWTLDENNGTRTSSVGSFPLSENGGTINAVAGINNQAADVASSRYFENLSFNRNPQGKSYTVSAWVNLGTLGTVREIVAKPGEWTLGVGADNKFFFKSDDNNGTNQATANTFGAATTGVWYHIVGVHALNAQNRIYVNAGTPDTIAAGDTNTFGNSLYVGANSGSFHYTGAIDEVGYWERVLNATEITALYNSGDSITYTSFDAQASSGGGTSYANVSELKTESTDSTSAVVSFKTDMDTTALVEYGTPGTFTSSVSLSSYKKLHTATLTGLKPNTEYSFRVKVATSAGATTTSLTGSFTTKTEAPIAPMAPTPPPPITPEPIPEAPTVPVPVVTEPVQIVFPYDVREGELLVFKNNPTVYLVRLDGLHAFDTYRSFLTYSKQSKQKLKQLPGPVELYTVSNIFASTLLGL